LSEAAPVDAIIAGVMSAVMAQDLVYLFAVTVKRREHLFAVDGLYDGSVAAASCD
jgi:hypothetical protein